VTPDHLGTIKRARVIREKAILYGDNETGDDIVERIAQIQEQLKGPLMLVQA
jgi:hypothetical protein